MHGKFREHVEWISEYKVLWLLDCQTWPVNYDRMFDVPIFPTLLLVVT